MAQLMPLPLTVSCSSKIQIGFTFLVPAYPGSPGQRAVKLVCVYERMTVWLCIAGARRFVVLDFGKPILLTDIIVPMCGDLASLSIDVWVDSEETDGHRLVVSSDIGLCSLIMNDIMPPPVCRFLKVNECQLFLYPP